MALPKKSRAVVRRTPVTAGERMRRYRARQKAAGLKEARRWVAQTPSLVPYSDHRLHEIRSLALHALIAKKLVRDPTLLAIAKRNIARWKSRQPMPPTYLQEWEEILAQPLTEVVALMIATDERAVRLRQSSPFVGVLSPEERGRLFDAFRA